MVAIALATKAGVTSGTWTVENNPIRFVATPMAAPCVNFSNERPQLSASPPRPRHFATGRMKSIPASSAMTETFKTSSHSQAQRSGAVLKLAPPSQFALKRPSLNLFGPRIGFGMRSICLLRITPQSALDLPDDQQLRLDSERSYTLHQHRARKTALWRRSIIVAAERCPPATAS